MKRGQRLCQRGHDDWFVGLDGRRRCRTCKLSGMQQAYRDDPRIRERIKASNKRWKKRHPDRVSAANRLIVRKRRSLMREQESIKRTDLDALMRFQEGRCVYCACELRPDATQLDHVVPLWVGGLHALSNLAFACTPCNQSKGRKLLVEWNRFRKLTSPICI